MITEGVGGDNRGGWGVITEGVGVTTEGVGGNNRGGWG